jgi:hypothetical protein
LRPSVLSHLLKDHFQTKGYRRFDLLGEGMEGVVFALGDERVGKLWFRRRPDELRNVKDFYAELGSQALPFAVPEVFEVDKVEGHAVTIEKELPGRDLRRAVRAGAISVDTARSCMMAVVNALATTTPGASAASVAFLPRGLRAVDEQFL